MNIVQVNVEKLKPAAYNPRKWSKEAVDNLKASIQKFGMVDPIIVNSAAGRKDIVIGGHFRLHVAKELSMKKVPVVYVNIPDETQEKELNLRLNKNLGEWDVSLLKNFFDPDVLELVGFLGKEVTTIFDRKADDDDFDVEAQLARKKKPTSKRGDIYALGDHRVMCGDSTSKKDVDILVAGKKIGMILTDPPYGVGFKYNTYNDKISKKEHGEFSEKWFAVCKQLADFIVITPSFGNERIFYGLGEPNQLVWYKKFGISASPIAFARVTEPIFVYGKPRLKRYDTDFFEYGTDREKDLHAQHPCPKPVGLLDALIVPQTKRGEIVLDVFLGSGSTLVAAEKSGRICYGMELDPIYVDVIIARWEKLTKQKAKKVESNGK